MTFFQELQASAQNVDPGIIALVYLYIALGTIMRVVAYSCERDMQELPFVMFIGSGVNVSASQRNFKWVFWIAMFAISVYTFNQLAIGLMILVALHKYWYEYRFCAKVDKRLGVTA